MSSYLDEFFQFFQNLKISPPRFCFGKIHTQRINECPPGPRLVPWHRIIDPGENIVHPMILFECENGACCVYDLLKKDFYLVSILYLNFLPKENLIETYDTLLRQHLTHPNEKIRTFVRQLLKKENPVVETPTEQIIIFLSEDLAPEDLKSIIEKLEKDRNQVVSFDISLVENDSIIFALIKSPTLRTELLKFSGIVDIRTNVKWKNFLHFS